MEAVCFDMDGVVVDSEVHWQRAERERIYPEALPGVDLDPEETTGMNYREIYGYLEERYPLAVDRERFLELYEAAARDVYGERAELMDGLPGLLSALRERGMALALVSSSPHAWIDRTLDRFDLEFDQLVSAEDVDAPGKPEPHVYRYAARELAVDPEDCAAVEDSRHGIDAAAGAGMTAIAYRSESNRGVDLSAADLVVEGPDELRTALLELVDAG